jgi:hypothetical protein
MNQSYYSELTVPSQDLNFPKSCPLQEWKLLYFPVPSPNQSTKVTFVNFLSPLKTQFFSSRSKSSKSHFFLLSSSFYTFPKFNLFLCNTWNLKFLSPSMTNIIIPWTHHTLIPLPFTPTEPPYLFSVSFVPISLFLLNLLVVTFTHFFPLYSKFLKY